jgi:hypothetical protein
VAIRRRRPTRRDDEPAQPSYTTPEQILAALPDDPRGSEIRTAYDRLRALGINGTRANQLIRDRVNGTDLASDPNFGNSDSDGDPDPDLVSTVPDRTNNPVINFVEDQMGGPLEQSMAGGGSGNRPAVRGLRKPQGDDEGPTDTLPDEFEGMTPEEAQDRLFTNAPNMTPEELVAVRDYAQDQAQAGDVAWVTVVELAGSELATAQTRESEQVRENEVNEQVVEPVERDATINSAVQNILDAVENGDIINRADALAEIVRAGYSPSDASQMFEDARKRADEELGDEGDEPGTRPTDQSVIDTPAPDWVMKLSLDATGSVLTPAQEGRIVEYWNAYNGTDYGSLDELAPFLQDANLNSQEIVKAALLDEGADMALQVRMPNGAPISVSQANVMNLIDNFGYDIPGIQRIARLMNMHNDMPLPYDDPQDNLMITASILRALNLEDDVGLAEQTDAEREARRQAQRHGLPGNFFRNQEPQPSTETSAERQQREISDPRSVRRPSGEELSFIAGQVQPRRMDVNIARANRSFREGWERYQDVGLAMLHSLDEGLASRVWSSGGDIDKLSPNDQQLANNLLRRASADQAATWREIAGDSTIAELMQQLDDRGGGAAGGAGPTRRVLDPVGVGEQYKVVMEALYGTTPPPEEINGVVQRLQAELDSADPGMSFDIAARIRAATRESPLFAELYGAKPEGMSDEQYRAMFQRSGEEFGGPGGATEEATRAGMRSNSIQGTVGNIAGNAANYRDNSTFLGRIAEIWDDVEEMT